MNINWRRTFAITRKEVYHILRDPFTLTLSMGLPMFMVFTFGYAIDFNTKYLPIAIYDPSISQSSRELVETFSSSQYFISSPVSSPDEALEAIAAQRVHAALILNPDFESRLFEKKPARVQLLLDGSDNSTVSPILNYVSSIQILASQRITEEKIPEILKIKTRFLFNPELNSQWFVIPGLAVVVMAMLSILLTALTVAREWENGSMELLLSTPVRPIEIILGKLAPYGIMALIAVFFVYLLSRGIFGIPFQGSHFVYTLGASIFLVTYLAQGLLISVLTRNQQLAMQFAMMSGMIPSQLLSGFIFPIESMPKFFQYFTMIFPARWYMTIARSSYLKGSMLSDMALAFLGLTVLCVIMVSLATHNFKRDLEP